MQIYRVILWHKKQWFGDGPCKEAYRVQGWGPLISFLGPDVLLFLLSLTYLSPAFADGLLCLLIGMDVAENGCFIPVLRSFPSQAIIGLCFLHLLVPVWGTLAELCVSFLQETHARLAQMLTYLLPSQRISKCQFLHLFVWGLLWPGCHCALADETG